MYVHVVAVDIPSVSVGLVVGLVAGWIADTVLPYHYEAWQDGRTERRERRTEWYREAAQIGQRAQSVWNRPTTDLVRADAETHAEIGRIADRLDEMRYESDGIDEEVLEAAKALADECHAITDEMEMMTDAEPLVRPSKADHSNGTLEHGITRAIEVGADLEAEASKRL
ncbi:hypothetical protein [Natrinema ejinorense]|uniref:Uncharacterized protein n=1 Tax=Natrinema ejinorense TaxID=373386 RepID=A0A2A5QV68_9EURY|nr:hypothetical protein [Natrinema ejinorense]PCR90736.1 hypothetical protein CP557_09565 [Natrinema ejinorense]